MLCCNKQIEFRGIIISPRGGFKCYGYPWGDVKIVKAGLCEKESTTHSADFLIFVMAAARS